MIMHSGEFPETANFLFGVMCKNDVLLVKLRVVGTQVACWKQTAITTGERDLRIKDELQTHKDRAPREQTRIE